MTHSQLNRRDWLRGAAVVSALGAVSTRARATLADRQRDVAWLDEVQQPPAQLPDKAPRLEPILKLTGNLEKDRAAWRKRRAEIQKWWTEFLHPFTDDRGAARKFKVVEQDRAAKTVVRQRIRYEVEPGVSTESYLLFPDTKQSTPGVVALHSTVQHSIRQPAGVEGKPEKAFGLRLAQQGCTVICPRNYLWPTNHKIDAQAEADRFLARRAGSKGMYKMLYDSQVALDILCAQPQVDVKRLGSVGHSLGAKEVVYLAAFDERVKVTVSSEGGIGVRFSNWNADWYLGPEIDKPSFQVDQHELLALVAPRPFLLIGGDSADGDQSWPFIERALPIYRLYGPRARLGLYNHKQGHAVPPQAEKRIYDWLETYL